MKGGGTTNLCHRYVTWHVNMLININVLVVTQLDGSI